MEIGNVQNQLNSTNRSLDSAKNERATVEQTLATQASQLSALQTQLSSANAAYETETKLLTTFRDRHSVQMAEMQKSREELIRAESDLSALRVEKSEIEGAFLRDKEEARDLHRKMIEVGQQVESLKSEIEKVKKDAKQQKGLLAIAKKQLSSREAEKAKIEKELEEANVEITSVTKELEEAESDLAKPLPERRDLSSDSLTFAASQVLPVSPDPSSPAGSIAGKSNNPFERLALSPEASLPRSSSPFVDVSQAAPAAKDVDFIESANKTSTNDPFGFSQTSEHDDETQPFTDTNGTLPESHRSTPRPDTSQDSVRSPASTEGSDRYVTPPTTANNHGAQSPATVLPIQQFPIVEDAASHFPDIGVVDSIPDQSSGTREEGRPGETDLGAQLKEIEVEQSDSASESEDEVPLAELTKTKSQDNAPPSHAIAGEPQASFDDVFGVIPTATATNAFLADTKDTADSSVLKPSTDGDHITLQSEIQTVAGVSAFDEAMGIIPNAVPSVTQQFSFDSAFDDNFDFASAAQLSQAPPAVADGNKSDYPHDAFTTSARNGVPATSTHNKPALVAPVPSHSPAKAEPAKTTFDEAFLDFDSGPKLNLDNSFSSPIRQVVATTPSPAQTTFPVSSPVSPTFKSSLPTGPVSLRARSPPPRVSSPKPRPSTSSLKETPDRPKEPSTRHSKLSVCIPVVQPLILLNLRADSIAIW